MKNYLIFVLFALLSLSSCGPEPVKVYDADQSNRETTLEILYSLDTNLQVALVGEQAFILRDSLVIHEARLTTNTSTVALDGHGFGIMLLLAIIGAMVLLAFFLWLIDL